MVVREDLDNMIAGVLGDSGELLLLALHLLRAHRVLGWDRMAAPRSVVVSSGLIVIVEEALAVWVVF